jgi:hypothetical protein
VPAIDANLHEIGEPATGNTGSDAPLFTLAEVAIDVKIERGTRRTQTGFDTQV